MVDDADEAKAAVLASLVGAVAVYSAMLEYIMDGMVHCIYNCVEGGKKGYSTEPHRAKQRQEYLENAFAKLSAFG